MTEARESDVGGKRRKRAKYADPPAWVLTRGQDERADRALATIVQLPRICRVRRCRRQRTCVGPGPACLAAHRGLVDQRWELAKAKAATRRRQRGAQRAKLLAMLLAKVPQAGGDIGGGDAGAQPRQRSALTLSR